MNNMNISVCGEVVTGFILGGGIEAAINHMQDVQAHLGVLGI
jgi:hypothetical protein